MISLVIKLRGFKKIRNKIIQRQLQMRMIKKNLKKDTSPEERQKIIDNLIFNIIAQ